MKDFKGSTRNRGVLPSFGSCQAARQGEWLRTRASAFLTVPVTYLLPGVVLDVKGEEAGGVLAQHIDLLTRLLQLVPAQV